MLTQKQKIANLEIVVVRLQNQINSLIELIGADSIDDWKTKTEADLKQHKEDQKVLDDYVNRTKQTAEGGLSCV